MADITIVLMGFLNQQTSLGGTIRYQDQPLYTRYNLPHSCRKKWPPLKGVPCRRCSSHLVGGFNPPEKYESQLGWFFPIYGKIKNGPNHQPDIPFFVCSIYPLPLSRCFFHVFPKVSLKKKHVAQPHEPESQISRLRPLAEQDDSNANLGFWSRCKHLSVKQK